MTYLQYVALILCALIVVPLFTYLVVYAAISAAVKGFHQTVHEVSATRAKEG